MKELFDQVLDHHPTYIKSNPDFLRLHFKDVNIEPYWIADMDFMVAEEILTAIRDTAERGVFAYATCFQDVAEAIVQWNKKRHDLDLNKDCFLQAPSVLTALSFLVRKFSEPGEGVLIQTPVYHQFDKVIKSQGRKLIDSPLIEEKGGYKMDFEGLERDFQKRNVRLMILCNPHNPVGRVWTKEELQRLIDLADKYNVRIISDEIHGDIIFSPQRFTSIMALTSSPHIALIGSPAKTFGMQSIANGYIYIPDKADYKIMEDELVSLYLDHGSIISMLATLAAYRHGEKWLNGLLDYLQDTIDWIEDFLKEHLPQVKLTRVEGTYLIWLDFSSLGLESRELEELLFQKAKVGLAPGRWFGAYKMHMRMTIASPFSKIKGAFERLESAINKM